MTRTRDPECVAFLQWALPHLGLRWPGFRKVRRQVCRRLVRRAGELKLSGLDAYRGYLLDHPGEWPRVAEACRVTISRFYRDRGVFDALRHTVLPELAHQARRRGAPALRIWSAGCASGEETWSLRLAWTLDAGRPFADLPLAIVATDADPHLLERARRAVYPASALRELPSGWHEEAFERVEAGFLLRERFRVGIDFRCEDLGKTAPAGPFDAVLCRNLAFTYFDTDAQRAVLDTVLERLVDGGALVVGGHETPPEEDALRTWSGAPSIYRRL